MADIAKTLDASGLACPMPVVRTRQAIDEIAPGELLQVISTDRGSLRDIPAWASSIGHTVVEATEDDGRFTFVIEKQA